MSELDARLDDAREAIATMGPPQDLWARVLERADAGAAVLDLPVAAGRRRISRWLAVGSVAACLLAVAAVVASDNDTVLTTDSASRPDEPVGEGSTVFAEDVEIVGFDDLRPMLDIDAVVRDAEATGQFRVEGIVVAIECADTRTSTGGAPDGRDLILGGQVTVNEDELTTLDDVDVALGDRVALIIREGLPAGQRVTLYEPSLWHGEQASAGSCEDLVESVPSNLDGGFFDHIVGVIRTP